MPRPHWSHSSLNQFLRCPRQWYLQRVLGLPRTSIPSGMVLGSAVHAALAEFHRGLRDDRKPDTKRMANAVAGAWEAEEDEGRTVTYKRGESKDDQRELAVTLVGLAMDDPPGGRVLDVERRLTVPLYDSAGEQLDRPLVAVMDVVTADLPDGAEVGDRDAPDVTVHEIKTSGRAYSESEAATSLQPTCYAHAAAEWYGGEPRVEFRVLVKTKTPKLQTLPAGRDAEDFGRLGDIARQVERAVEAGAFYPVENPMNCFGCAWRKECREMPLVRHHRRDDGFDGVDGGCDRGEFPRIAA